MVKNLMPQKKTFLKKVLKPGAFITKKNKYSYGLLLAGLSVFLYLSSNHWHFSPPQLLPMTSFDLNIPFIPETIWIYSSEYLYFIIVYVSSRNFDNLSRYFYSFLAQQTISVFIYCIWPTTFPRELYPLPKDLDPASFWLFSSMRSTDTPASCCPSLHVSSVFLSNLIVLNDLNRKYFNLFFIWGASIILSTLTTKQHYLLDVLSGLILAWLTYWVFHQWKEKPTRIYL